MTSWKTLWPLVIHLYEVSPCLKERGNVLYELDLDSNQLVISSDEVLILMDNILTEKD